MTGLFLGSGLSPPLSFSGELVGVTLVLSTIEYAVLGLVIGRAFHGKKLRRLAHRLGWTWRRGDPDKRLVADAPRVLGPQARSRRVKFTVCGDSELGPFVLWVYRNPRRRRSIGRQTILVSMPTPIVSPGVLIAVREEGATEAMRYSQGADSVLATVWSPALSRLIQAHPDVAWDWTGDRLIVASTKIKTLDGLQDLICAAEKFRALTPEAEHPSVRAAAPVALGVTA